MQLCSEVVKDSACVIAGDTNSSIGSVCSRQIGDHAPEEEDQAGEFLHQLLQICHAWVPASFGHVHRGQSWTYCQKRNGKLIRPDLVAVPEGWWWGTVRSQVDVGIHAGQPISLLRWRLQLAFRLQVRLSKLCRQEDDVLMPEP